MKDDAELLEAVMNTSSQMTPWQAKEIIALIRTHDKAGVMEAIRNAPLCRVALGSDFASDREIVDKALTAIADYFGGKND